MYVIGTLKDFWTSWVLKNIVKSNTLLSRRCLLTSYFQKINLELEFLLRLETGKTNTASVMDIQMCRGRLKAGFETFRGQANSE